jgi:hypothetical protein
MKRAQLVAEIESYGLEVHGNIHDLRDTVKLARQICRDFSSVPEVLEGIPLLMKNLTQDETLNFKTGDTTWTIDVDGDIFILTDGYYTHQVTLQTINDYIKEKPTSIEIYNNLTGSTREVN